MPILAATGLFGCAAGNAPLVEILSEVAADKLGSGSPSAIPAQPNPLYTYLRVEVAGRPAALLVLGYVDAHPLGEIEVWYSAKREVIKTQNGRIIATAGLELDWRAVNFLSSPPAWTAVPSQGSVYGRSRDEMPGYRYAITDRLELQPWGGVPPITLSTALPVDQARSYGWFQESTLESTAQPLPPSWFAMAMRLGRPTVVYSEQCLSASFCLKLMRWPLQASPS